MKTVQITLLALAVAAMTMVPAHAADATSATISQQCQAKVQKEIVDLRAFTADELAKNPDATKKKKLEEDLLYWIKSAPDDIRECEEDVAQAQQNADRAKRIAELDKRKAELDKRNAELDKRKAELDKRNAELDRQLADLKRQDAIIDRCNSAIDTLNAQGDTMLKAHNDFQKGRISRTVLRAAQVQTNKVIDEAMPHVTALEQVAIERSNLKVIATLQSFKATLQRVRNQAKL